MSVDYRPNYDPADVDHEYGHTGGDITVPTFTGDTRPFRFWCQKALPLVYDDSLSYYEVLCKMADYLNNFMSDLTTVEDSMTEFGEQFVLNQQFLNTMADQLGQNVADLETYINDRMTDFMGAYTQLQTYVNTYFDNLDVQEEINSKLDDMASDGTLNNLFDPVLETWMQQKTAQIDAAISNQDAIQAAQNARISVLEGRMDTFEGLPAGSTAGNAELVGIRTNFLGEIYPTAGDAVRASDMIASGFVSIPITRLEEWNGNAASSTYDTIQFDISAYKGGHVIMIANMENFIDTAETIGIGVIASNVSGKTEDQNAHAYALTSNVFPSYSVIPTQITGEERIALFFSIPEEFSYQYLKMGYVEEIPHSDYTQPAAIVYANSWSKTQVDPTLTIAGDAADAKAAGDAIDELNERLDDENADITSLKDATGIYQPPTASGITPQNNSANVVLSPITLVRGHTYKYEVTLANASDAAAYLAMWMEGASTYFNIKTIAAGDTTASKEFYNATNTDSAYMTITPNGRALSYTVKITDLSVEGNYITELQGKVGVLEGKTGEMEQDVSEISALTIRAEAETTTKDITDTLEYTVGSMNTDGSRTSDSSYYRTEKIPVSEGDIVFTASQYTRYRVVTAFYNGAVVSASSAENVFSYTVPSGVDAIVVTIYANQSRVYGTINITGFGRKQNILENRVSNAEENHSHTYAKRHPMVTFIDDDGNVEFYTYLLPIMRTYGIPMVSAYMGDSNPDMNSNLSMMTKAQCDEVVKAGGELIVHYNPDATALTLDEAEAVMVKSQKVLEKYGFSKGSRLVAYSHGTSNTDIRAMVSKHFDCAFSGAYPRVSAMDRSNHDCIVQYAIHREPCGGLYYDQSTDCTTLQYFKDMIDECISSNGWLVFTMHSWLMPEGQRQSPWENVDQLGLLEDIIEYIQSLQQNNSNIEIVTASKGFEAFGNAWQAGDYLGHWNEQTLTNTPTLGDHSQPGCAVNKLGQYDFPSSNAITHS